MSVKEIIGFETNNNNDSICPNCGNDFNIPIAGTEGFWTVKLYHYYTCSKCGLQWKIKK